VILGPFSMTPLSQAEADEFKYFIYDRAADQMAY